MGDGNVGDWRQLVLVFIFHPICGDKSRLRGDKVCLREKSDAGRYGWYSKTCDGWLPMDKLPGLFPQTFSRSCTKLGEVK
jgi:hypothetical protein